jgi:hypothetical protein
MRDADDHVVQNPVERQKPELGLVRFAIQRLPISIIVILVVMALGMLASTRLVPPASPIVSASTSTEAFPVEIQQSLRDRLPPGEIRLTLSRTTFQPGVLLAAQAINGPITIWVSTGELTIKPVGPGVELARAAGDGKPNQITTSSEEKMRSGDRVMIPANTPVVLGNGHTALVDFTVLEVSITDSQCMCGQDTSGVETVSLGNVVVDSISAPTIVQIKRLKLASQSMLQVNSEWPSFVVPERENPHFFRVYNDGELPQIGPTPLAVYLVTLEREDN